MIFNITPKASLEVAAIIDESNETWKGVSPQKDQTLQQL